MRPTVATVLTARPWEEAFVAVTRHTAAVRLVGRAYEPIDLDRIPRPDWVVVGAETAWLSAEWVRVAQAGGSAVLGVFGDEGEAAMLEGMGVDVLAHQHGDPLTLMERLLIPPPSRSPSGHEVIAVLGPSGAGGTTVAIALGEAPGTAIVDTDPIPGVGPALGMAPPPGRMDLEGTEAPGAELSPGGPTVLTVGGEPRPAAIVTAASNRFEKVVVDATPGFHPRVGWCATDVVLVVDASVQGMLRGIELSERWAWPRPRLVLNRVTDVDGALEAARAALGLEPEALVPLSLDPLAAAGTALAVGVGARVA